MPGGKTSKNGRKEREWWPGKAVKCRGGLKGIKKLHLRSRKGGRNSEEMCGAELTRIRRKQKTIGWGKRGAE